MAVNGIFITSELTGQLAARIRAVQERFDPRLAKELPPHVTHIGSSGAGPIDAATPIAVLRESIARVASVTPPLTLAFRPPMRFIGREIVVLPLDPHGLLRALHEALKKNGLKYETARWPFTPHCTLNYYATLTPESLRGLLAVREPEPWVLDTLRVYHTRDGVRPKHLFDVRLGAPGAPSAT
ncbi:MAG: 2'-5' RNA ligase family protein [Gemmatimonadetes bacterium]|nr:2'-5' RNA ligase family protein [Gemmatimonadota bacterium]